MMRNLVYYEDGFEMGMDHEPRPFPPSTDFGAHSKSLFCSGFTSVVHTGGDSISLEIQRESLEIGEGNWSELESIPRVHIHTGGPVIESYHMFPPTYLHHLCGCEWTSLVPEGQFRSGVRVRGHIARHGEGQEMVISTISKAIVSACLGGQEGPCRMNRTSKTKYDSFTFHVAKSQPCLF